MCKKGLIKCILLLVCQIFKIVLLQVSGQLREIEEEVKEQRRNTLQILDQLEEQLKSMDQIHELLTEIRFLDGIEEIEAMYFAFMEGRHLFTTLKVRKHENFSGSDFEFLTSYG